MVFFFFSNMSIVPRSLTHNVLHFILATTSYNINSKKIGYLQKTPNKPYGIWVLVKFAEFKICYTS